MDDSLPAEPTNPGRRQVLARSGTLALAASAAFVTSGAAKAQATSAHSFVRRVQADDPFTVLGGPPALPSLSVVALNRMAFGPRPGDIAAFEALGATDQQRIEAYLAIQLDPDNIDDSALDARLAGFVTLAKPHAQLWQDHYLSEDPDQRRLPLLETASAALIRAVYSERQLFEVLADFWHNHFNVDGTESASVFVQYDRDVIRPHILGNFREMLEAVAKSPAMLNYLDNLNNTVGGPNENYARELIELHTMGFENFLGALAQLEVPNDAAGTPLAYVDGDVYEATRCFTGWGLDLATGLFQYTEQLHDRFQKFVLGTLIPNDQSALKDGQDVMDLLASHPLTAQFVSEKLCRRLISDNPPQSLVNQAAAVFVSQWQAPDQLKQVVETILLSPEFQNTFGEKMKRPLELAASAMRAGSAEYAPIINDPDSDEFLAAYAGMGQPPFSFSAPTGYPDMMEAWQATAARVGAWRFANVLSSVPSTVGVYLIDALAQTPPAVRSANGLADFWIDLLLQRPMAPEDRQEIVDFMAQQFSPDLDLPVDTDPDTESRLRAMVALIIMSPEFLWR